MHTYIASTQFTHTAWILDLPMYPMYLPVSGHAPSNVDTSQLVFHTNEKKKGKGMVVVTGGAQKESATAMDGLKRGPAKRLRGQMR